MSDWAWVALGYGVVYGVVAVYAAQLIRRVHVARRDRALVAGTVDGAE